MYAIVCTGGKQYRVTEGEVITVERIPGQVGDAIALTEVLLVQGEEGLQVGTPIVPGASVQGQIVRQDRGKKIIVFKHKRRKGYRKKQGHRQDLTWLRIQKIALTGSELPPSAPAEEGEARGA
ncbi:MAG: 50S ribosomal protein L21 [Candidatus Tectomicrobia bacterium]|uniref:Large ribosomal subunit protein bL21 n=1 Tax=Tectimicrobiota bacterium TaxID=2528274 RepID=A0A932FVZ9_UNCTE|nr:50S ribosomal protein L21 [Candidatus Tectomicrobia bacterium]